MGQTLRPVDFGTVLIVVAIVAAVVAVASFWGTGRIYSGLGRSGLADHGRATTARPAPSAPSGARGARGDPPDARGEVGPARGARARSRSTWTRSWTRSPAPPGPIRRLREEVRQLVVARNERRLRHGEEPLDVEAEVERQLRDLGA